MQLQTGARDAIYGVSWCELFYAHEQLQQPSGMQLEAVLRMWQVRAWCSSGCGGG